MRPIFCFCGASGSGKTGLVDWLSMSYGLVKAQTITDRPRRTPDETGYLFLTPYQFDCLSPGSVIEQTVFAGHRYASTKAELDKADLVTLDLKGIDALQMRYNRPKVSIGIYASDIDRAHRMRKRGDSEDAIKIRLEHDAVAFGLMMDYCDYVVKNDDFETTLRRILNIIQYEQQKT